MRAAHEENNRNNDYTTGILASMMFIGACGFYLINQQVYGNPAGQGFLNQIPGSGTNLSVLEISGFVYGFYQILQHYNSPAFIKGFTVGGILTGLSLGLYGKFIIHKTAGNTEYNPTDQQGPNFN